MAKNCYDPDNIMGGYEWWEYLLAFTGIQYNTSADIINRISECERANALEEIQAILDKGALTAAQIEQVRRLSEAHGLSALGAGKTVQVQKYRDLVNKIGVGFIGLLVISSTGYLAYKIFSR